jgi:hypothetical protein
MEQVLYYNCVNMVIKECILRKAWEGQLAMLVAKNKIWARSMKKWLLKIQPQEMAGFMPLVKPPLETALKLTTTHVLQVEEPATTHAL